MSRPSVRFLTGAPLTDSLDWRDEGLLNTLSTSFQRHLLLDSTLSSTPGPTQIIPAWRVVPLSNRTFYESPPLQRNVNLRPTKHGLKVSRPGLEQDHDFLEFSFAVHTELQSSQIAHQPDTQEEPDTTFVTESSILSDSNVEITSFLGADQSLVDETQYPAALSSNHSKFTGPVMSVKAIPTSAYLQHLQPQTMTINLVIGIINVAPARTVRTRRGGYDMEIIEIMVGDDTKAGFTISSWHTPQESQRKVQDELRKVLHSLRPQDVVLVERLALSSFNSQVFGQTLNRRETKNTTAITVLHRAKQPADESQKTNWSPALQTKVDRVRSWAASFVGPGTKRGAPDDSSSTSRPHHKSRKQELTVEDDSLPPDTQ